jgi:hypothetical protein
MIVQIFERSLGISDINSPRPLQGYPRGEAFAEYLETDGHVGGDHVLFALPDTDAQAPREEFRIGLDLGDKIEKLFRRIGKSAFLRVRRHGGTWLA